MSGPDIGASIRARLLAKAKAGGQDCNLVLTRYARERLLYRVGASGYAERFLLTIAIGIGWHSVLGSISIAIPIPIPTLRSKL